MLKALVIKELRETVGLVALAVFGAIYMFGELMATPVVPWQGSRLYHYPFIGDWFDFYFWIVAGGLAIALGLRQTSWEFGQGTYFFLLHRPLPRARIFLTKLLVGGGLLLTFSAAIILIYALWASAPRHVPAPFEWRMTVPQWVSWVETPLVYVGAFLSGIRPGRWFGTRLVPLVAAIAFALMVSFIPWLGLAIVVSLVGIAIGLVSIFYYVRERDF